MSGTTNAPSASHDGTAAGLEAKADQAPVQAGAPKAEDPKIAAATKEIGSTTQAQTATACQPTVGTGFDDMCEFGA